MPEQPKLNAPRVRFSITLPQKQAGTRWARENPEKVPEWARPAQDASLDWQAVCAALGTAFVIPALDALLENQERVDADAELETVDDKIARATRLRIEADEKLVVLKRRRDELVRLPVDDEEPSEPPGGGERDPGSEPPPDAAGRRWGAARGRGDAEASGAAGDPDG